MAQLVYRTLPAQWKKFKPTLMGKTGVGEILSDLTPFDIDKIPQPLIAKAWATRFDTAIKDLIAASSRDPIKSNAKTKTWVTDIAMELGKVGTRLGRMADGTLVYDQTHKEWVAGAALKKELGIKDGADLKFVTKAWPKLSAATRLKIVKLAGG